MDLLVPPQFFSLLMDIKSKQNKGEKNEGLGSLPGGIQSAIETALSEMVFSLKELVSNLTVDECGIVSSNSQHTEAIVGVQTTLTRTQKYKRGRIQKMEQEAESAEPALKEKVHRTKRFKSEVRGRNSFS